MVDFKLDVPNVQPKSQNPNFIRHFLGVIPVVYYADLEIPAIFLQVIKHGVMENPRTEWRCHNAKMTDKWSIFQRAMFEYHKGVSWKKRAMFSWGPLGRATGHACALSTTCSRFPVSTWCAWSLGVKGRSYEFGKSNASG